MAFNILNWHNCWNADLRDRQVKISKVAAVEIEQVNKLSTNEMRRPLIRHLSEGGGGDGNGRKQSAIKTSEDLMMVRGSGGGSWDCRDYKHHLSTYDLLKVPATNHRGQLSPEPRTVTLSSSGTHGVTGAFHRLVSYDIPLQSVTSPNTHSSLSTYLSITLVTTSETIIIYYH